MISFTFLHAEQVYDSRTVRVQVVVQLPATIGSGKPVTGLEESTILQVAYTVECCNDRESGQAFAAVRVAESAV